MKKKKKNKKLESHYIRDSIYSIEEVLPFIGNHEKEYNGRMVKMKSQRYECFSEKGTKCVACGLKGEFFSLERARFQENDRYHFNLYAINDKGEEILMTKDHIHPVSKGGKNWLENYQTMCCKCNVEKSNKVTS